MENIYVTKAFLPPKEKYIEKLEMIWQSHQLTNMGPLHKEFEDQLREYLDVPGVLAFSNGHMALEMAIQALELQGEVITTPFTFASTTHAIVRNGLTPVFCDIRRDNYTIDADQIESLITEKTCAIVPVHVYGQICDVDKIQNIADKYKLKVIYDAAHAFGERYRGMGIGNFGDASMFSFHATKPFNSIEGGLVSVKDYSYGLKIYQLKNFGITGEDRVTGIGGNAKMSEFHAAMGLCNLDYMEEITSKRKSVVERYRENLKDVNGLILLPDQEDVEENYAYMPVYIDKSSFGMNRDEVVNRLKRNHIFARKYFYPLTKDFTAYGDRFRNQNTPVAEDVANNILTLPLYDSLALDDVDRICKVLLEKK